MPRNPSDKPADRSERLDQWHDHYQPRSPSAVHKTNQCAKATLLADRADAFEQAELQKQARETRHSWHRRQRRRVIRLAGQMRKNPWRTVQKLKSFGTGLAFIIESFGNMIVELEQRGYFEPEGLEGVILFFGKTPDDATICRDQLAYTITVNALGCLPEQPAPDLAKWLEPVNRPFPLRNKPREELMGADADACRAVLVKTIREALIPLRELHARVVKEVDEPLLLEALQRASILEEPAARRVAHGRAEARQAYHRTWRDLVEVLDSDEEKGTAGFGRDEEDQDHDQDQEAVVVEEPAVVSVGGDEVLEPARRGSKESSPFQPPHPDGPWEELTPQARSALEARDREILAEIGGRVESTGAEQLRRELGVADRV